MLVALPVLTGAETGDGEALAPNALTQTPPSAASLPTSPPPTLQALVVTPTATTATVAAASATPAPTATAIATKAATPTPRPPTATPSPTATPNPTAGLRQIGYGPAAFYDPSYDQGGWDAIIRRQTEFGNVDTATFAYSPQGYYCVHPDYDLGAVFVLQNPRTGATIRCTVADAVNRYDIPLWRSRWHVEMSYAAFADLGLRDGENLVAVYA